MSEQPAVAAIGQVQADIASMTVGMSHHFAVLIDDWRYHLGDWSTASGLSVKWDQLKHKTGESGNWAEVLPGTTEYQPITLTRAASPYSRVVQYWLAQTSKHPRPVSGTIQLVTFIGTPIVQWRLEFFPIEWSIDSFDAGRAKPVIETLRLAHTGFLDDDFALFSPF